MVDAKHRIVIHRFLWGIMALYLLNISVDAADPNPAHLPEDLTFNDQESIVEIILEKVLGFEDAIVEFDDRDAEDHNKKNPVKIELFDPKKLDVTAAVDMTRCNNHRFPHTDNRIVSAFYEIDTPPPRS